jgi:hypothetical protein
MKIMFDGSLISIQKFKREMNTYSVKEASKCIKNLVINYEFSDRFEEVEKDPLDDFRMCFSLEELLLWPKFIDTEEGRLAKKLKNELLK